MRGSRHDGRRSMLRSNDDSFAHDRRFEPWVEAGGGKLAMAECRVSVGGGPSLPVAADALGTGGVGPILDFLTKEIDTRTPYWRLS